MYCRLVDFFSFDFILTIDKYNGVHSFMFQMILN